MEIDHKVIETYALFKRHVLLLENLVSTQTNVISDIEICFANGKDDKLSEVLAVFNYVFSFTDIVARIYKIALSIPRLNHKSVQYQDFEKSLGNIKEIRNRFQHINREIQNNDKDHLLGAVSWLSGNRLYCLTFPDFTRNRSSTSIPIELTKENGFFALHRISYVLNDECYDILRIYEACLNLCQYIDSKISLTDQDGIIDLRKKYDAWYVDIHEKSL